jgi:acetyl esterase/lipase
VKQAEVFAAALEKQGTVVELVKMEGAGHGGFGKDPARTLARLNAFLVKHLLKP